jgi:hypothetical protein
MVSNVWMGMGSFPWLIYKKFDYYSTKQHNPFKTHANGGIRMGRQCTGGLNTHCTPP